MTSVLPVVACAQRVASVQHGFAVAPTPSSSSTTTTPPLQQLLVRFQDKTHVVSIPPPLLRLLLDNHDDNNDNDNDHNIFAHIRTWLLHDWAPNHLPGRWQPHQLRITTSSLQQHFPFCTISVISSLRGGKGGFGTLLKGQSRQAGAKLTTDFGACRDLQGRRLRHVNDEIKLRKWREMERRKANGETVPDDELWKTPSGIYNWHLMTPTWADISKKATYRIKRQFQQIDKEKQKQIALKQEQEEAYQKSMTHYLEQATMVTAEIQESLQDAIQQGLNNNNNNNNTAADSNKKRKRPMTANSAALDALAYQPNSLCTLSGDLVVNNNNNDKKSIEIQSKSDFGTAVFVLDRQIPENRPIVYYEVSLETGGLAQIGWARLVASDKNNNNYNNNDGNDAAVFRPNDGLGDGVGDDAASFGVDGSRGMKFHAGTEEAYNSLEWKQGDRLGCLWDTSNGSLSFHVNGKDYGVAFTTTTTTTTTSTTNYLVPAFSCNQGEILELHIAQEDCKYFPATKAAVAVGELIESSVHVGEDEDEDMNVKKPAVDAAIQKEEKEKAKTVAVVEKEEPAKKAPFDTENIKPLNLSEYESAKELEALGMDRLKGAMMAIKVKCGGTLAERAARLFSLKGLQRKDFPKKVRAKGFLEY